MQVSYNKIIYIDKVSHSKHVPSTIKDGNNYFTYGWGGKCSRKFKEYNQNIKVECWKTDNKIKNIYERKISGVHFRIFPAYRVKYLGDYSLHLIKYLKSEIKKNNRIIFNISSFRHLLFYSVALKLKDFPVVVQHHGEASAIYKFRISRGVRRLYYLLQIPFEKLAFKNIDLLYVIDENIIKYLPVSIPSSKIKLQNLGIEPQNFPILEKKESKKLLGLDPDKKYLFHVGKLNFAKGVDVLLSIYKELKKDRQDIKLILGGTKKEDTLYNIAEETGAILYGPILYTEMYKFLTAADVYVLPTYRENDPFGGVGLLPLEALLCNTPIVGNCLKNFPKEDREAVGYVVSEQTQIKESILKIIDNKVSFDNLREIAIKHYSWENIIKSTLKDYIEILNKYWRIKNDNV